MNRSAKLFLLILTALALAVPATPAAAGDGIWTPLGPYGAQITALAVDPSDPDVVYAGAQRAGIYKSTDGGASWGFAGRGIGSEVVVAFAIDPVHPGTVYAAGEEGAVFKTTDGGAGWVRVWAGAPPAAGLAVATYSLVLDARRPHLLFAGTGEGLYRSTDGGATWNRRGRNLPGSFRSLAHDAAGGWLYAGIDGQGIFRSFNRGDTWERVSTGLPPNQVYLFLAVDPDQPRTLLAASTGGLYRSLDRGRRWQRASGVPQEIVRTVAFQRHGRAYAGCESGVFRSTDSGATWRPSADLPGRTFAGVQALAAGPDLVHLGLLGDPDGPGLYRSLDTGDTWEPAADGLPGSAVTEVAVDPSDARTIYAVIGQISLLKTTDGGATWSRLAPGSHVLIDPTRPSTLWLVGGPGPFLQRSDDAGETWQPCGEPDAWGLRVLAMDPRAPEALWGGNGIGVHHSADGGLTWKPRGPGSFLSTHYLEVDPRDPDVVYAAGTVILSVRPPVYALALYRSADGGLTWERRDAGLDGSTFTGFAIDAADPATLYAMTGSRLFRSTDAGVSWTAAPGLPGFFVTVATAPAGPDTPAAVYVAGHLHAKTVLRSTDRGETWTPLRRGLAPGLPVVLEVDPTDPAHLLLGTENRSLLSYTLGGAQ